MSRRERDPEAGPRVCAWCTTGHHTPRAEPRSKGCTRYHSPQLPPCPCRHYRHEEPSP